MAKTFEDSPGLLRELGQDEKIVWKGEPRAFPLMNQGSKKGLTRRWLGCIVLAVALITAYIMLNAGVAGGVNVWVLIITLAAVLYYALIPAIDRSSICKKCRYYITDRRVILEYAGRDIYSLPLPGVKSEISPAEAGCIHIDLGSYVGISGSRRGVAAVTPKKDDGGNVCGLILFNVADDKLLRSIFSNK